MRINGVVQKGKNYGVTIGFPTANIPAPAQCEPGIYAARAWLGTTEYKAAVFIDLQRKILEAHLLDFSGDIYGKELQIELVQKIRDSKKFEDEKSLIAAIHSDVEAVRAVFSAV